MCEMSLHYIRAYLYISMRMGSKACKNQCKRCTVLYIPVYKIKVFSCTSLRLHQIIVHHSKDAKVEVSWVGVLGE